MRLYFPNLTRPKKAAKEMARVLGRTLSNCQFAVARACGYRDWHELERQVEPGRMTVLDQDLSASEYIDRQIALTLRLSDATGVDDGAAQFAILRSHLSGDRRTTLAEELAIRVSCFRRQSLPDLGRRQRGSVGWLKSPGRTEEHVILKRCGEPTYVLTHRSTDMCVAEFEYVSPKVQLPLFVPMRLYLVYGAWTESDGARVLFSRDYKPLWRIRGDGHPERALPWERIRYEKSERFWDDRSPPWWNSRRVAEEVERLDGFGVVGLPQLVDVLPSLVLRDDITHIDDAVELLREAHEPATADR